MDRDTHPLVGLETVALIAVGGFAGANLRYALGGVLPGLPGTLAANVAGSLLLGFLTYEAVYAGVVSKRGRLVLTTGFLSSFTTYSTFAVQTALAPEWAVANVAANYGLGFAAVVGGRTLASRLGTGPDADADVGPDAGADADADVDGDAEVSRR